MPNFPQAIEDKGNKTILSVFQLNQSARILMEKTFQQIWVQGELSNVALPRSGHIYFTLKDNEAQIRCALFKGNHRRLHFLPKEGMAVLVQATVSIYEARGDYQLIVTHMEEWGVGVLQQAFEALKAKLQHEGLFDSIHKKPLPRFPRHIGVITSHTGAAIQDILSVLKRRYPIAPITIYHTLVQGKKAALNIVKAIEYANLAKQVDVLIVARGGGSLEDLFCFNEEIVARAIYTSFIPIVSGIGHEVDFTIADFVADLRAPTPSAAAETITPDGLELQQHIQQKQMRLTRAMERLLQHATLKIDALEKQLVHPGQRLEKLHIKLNTLSQQCTFWIKQHLKNAEHHLAKAMAGLHHTSPLATLHRGYSITTRHDTQEIIQDRQQIQIGEQVKTQLATGSFISTINHID